VRKIRTDQLDVQALAGLTALQRESIYCGLDNCVTHEVLAAMLPQLDNTTASTYAFSRALQGPILEMTIRGLRVDLDRRDRVLRTIREDIANLSEGLDQIIRDGIGSDASWRSPQQLMKLFYTTLNLTPIRHRTAAGMRPTVDREALEKLSVYFLAEPICLYLLALRDLDKKRQILETGIDRDGRMRTNFNIAGTNTGRLASAISDFGTGTNLQNIDRELRSIFVADPGHKLANLDLEQADARNVGAICWNTFVEAHGESFAGSYLDACEGGDLHTTVCRMAWQDLPWLATEPRRVADQTAYRSLSYRDLAKKLGHGTNYYGSPATMARHTKVDRHTIEDFQARYFAAFPTIGTTSRSDHLAPNWHNSVRHHLKSDGYITTLLGRRRYFFGRWNDDATLREAIAYEPQSLTADEIDLGLLALFRADRVQLLVQVHDSILFQYPEQQESDIIPWALRALRIPIALAQGREFVVPVEAKVGWNWADAGDTNVDGLIKWRGSDSRTRSESPLDPKPPSLRQRLAA